MTGSLERRCLPFPLVTPGGALACQPVRTPRWLVVCLLLALSGAPSLASASPPDPSWVPGAYDGADHDDVVVAILSLAGVRDHPSPTLAPPARVVIAVALLAAEQPPSVSRPAPSGRAPPLS
jgi:hypothetical protein